MKHNGTLDDLKTIVRGCGFMISEVKEQDNCNQIKTKEGAIINWYHSTGTLSFQGKKAPKEKLIEAWGTYTGNAAPMQTNQEYSEQQSSPISPENPNTASKRVFVVHGHDIVAREQLELILHKLV